MKKLNLEPMEMTFTIEDADLDKLHEALQDINVEKCPWFDVQDRHGTKARYYREPHQKLLDDGTLIVHTDIDITKITRVNITQNNTHYGDLFYRDEE